MSGAWIGLADWYRNVAKIELSLAQLSPRLFSRYLFVILCFQSKIYIYQYLPELQLDGSQTKKTVQVEVEVARAQLPFYLTPEQTRIRKVPASHPC